MYLIEMRNFQFLHAKCTHMLIQIYRWMLGVGFYVSIVGIRNTFFFSLTKNIFLVMKASTDWRFAFVGLWISFQNSKIQVRLIIIMNVSSSFLLNTPIKSSNIYFFNFFSAK